MSGKQIEFPPKQTHVKVFEYAMLVICVVLVIVVLVIVFGTNIGDRLSPDLR